MILSMLAIGEGLGTALYIGGTLLAAASGTYSAINSTGQARKGRQMQRSAQQTAMNAALKNEQNTENDLIKAKQKQNLDIASLLAAQQTGGGRSGTMLTGSAGVASNSLLGG
jgi:hypothetical protein